MQHHDGELSPREAAEMEELLHRHPVARAELAGLAQLGDFLRCLAEQRSAGADDLAATVMRRLDTEPVQVFGLHPRPPPAAQSAPGRRWVWAAVGGLAAAAAIPLLLFARSAGNARVGAARLAAAPGSAARSATAATHPAPGEGPLASAPRNPAEPGVSIEAVDFGQRNGTIFMVPAGGEATTPVVWVVDQPVTSGGETRPL